MKESSGAEVFRVLTAIAAVFLIGIASGMLVVRYTVFNPDFWISIINEGDVFKNTIIETVEVPDELEDVIDDPDEFMSDYMDIVIDEFSDLFAKGDCEVDRDALDDLFDDHVTDRALFEAAITEQYGSSKEGLYDHMDDSLEEVYDALEDVGYYKALKTIDRRVTTPAIVMICIPLVLYAVMIPIHKNKAKVLTSLGIATTVGEGIFFVICLGITGILYTLMKEGTYTSEGIDIEDFVKATVGRITLKINLIVFAALAAGIVMIVIGSILSKRYKNEHADEERYAPVPNGQNYNNYNNYSNYNNYNNYGSPVQGPYQGASGSYSNIDDIYDE